MSALACDRRGELHQNERSDSSHLENTVEFVNKIQCYSVSDRARIELSQCHTTSNEEYAFDESERRESGGERHGGDMGETTVRGRCERHSRALLCSVERIGGAHYCECAVFRR